MAPLKFEENIKEKLEERVIKPTDNSWDKLSAQLDKTQNRIPKKSFEKIWWYGIAAIFVGVIIVTSVFKNVNPVSDQVNTPYVNHDNESTEQNTTDLVEQEKINEKAIEEDEGISFNPETTDQLVESSPHNANRNIQPKSNNAASGSSKPKSFSKEQDVEINNSSLASSTGNDKVLNDHPKDVLTMDSQIVDKKVTDVIAQIKDMQSNNIEVTEDEINRLLYEAQREIITKNVIKSNAVSASALLQGVEEELDETFKERVYEALKTGFIKVRTSVAQRKN